MSHPKRIVITGGNGGLGLEAAKQLAARGDKIVIACRNRAKAERALESTGLQAELLDLDLGSLDSVRRFVDALRGDPLDVLINNAGVMALPRALTDDGFEQQLGINHLGHFALTALLLRAGKLQSDACIVNVSSTMHKVGRIDFDDLQSERRYSPWRAYAQSKLANLLFGFELARRLEAVGSRRRSVACHPGYAATDLQTAGAKLEGSALKEWVLSVSSRLFAQNAAGGAEPLVFAATDPSAVNGSYVGPAGWFELRGGAKLVRAAAKAHALDTASRLWSESERLTGVSFPVDA